MVSKVGRKTKLTPELQARIVEVLAAGNYIEAACDFVGIDSGTFHRWMEKGLSNGKGEQIYREFRDAVKRAQAQAEIGSVARIRKAGMEGEWTADAWYLERSHPDRWGRREMKIRQEIVNVSNLSDDELRAIIEDKGGG